MPFADTGQPSAPRPYSDSAFGTRAGAFFGNPDVAGVMTLVLVCLFFGVFAEGFASVDNAQSIVASVAIVACMALGLNIVLLAGEIDVSAGSTLALAGFVAGPIAVESGSLWQTLAVGLLVGCAAGVVNGLIVAFTRVPSIVATLGTLYVYQGLALLWSDSKNVVSVPESASGLGAGSLFGVPVPALVVLAAFGVLAAWRHNTNLGRDLIAVGANPRAAHTMGVRIRIQLLVAFTLAGTLAGLAAVMYLGQVGGIQTSVSGTTLVLQVVAACAIGGTSIQGGRGTNLAPITGALLVGVITAGVVVLGVPGVWFDCFYGGLILIAVARDRLLWRTELP